MKILLAEDDRRIAGFIVKGLREEGYTVEHVADGDAALAYALAEINTSQASTGANIFDLIILDIMMPGRDGIAVCRELRTQGVRTPILMLTAMDTLADRVRGLDSGADDYLVKPFDFPEMLARLRALARRLPTAVTINMLQVADLVLNLTERFARRGSRAIELSNREFHLLEYLMRNAGRTVSRTTLLQAVWGFDYEGASNVVDVYVGYLRRKVDLTGEPPLLHTVRNAGYRIAG